MFNLTKKDLWINICTLLIIICIASFSFFKHMESKQEATSKHLRLVADLTIEKEKILYEQKQLQKTNNFLEDELIKLKKFDNRTANVTITFYAPALGGINADKNPKKTAIMETPKSGWTVAISRDLAKMGWLGQKIYIEGLGVRYASDLMAKSYKGKKITKQIDICSGKNALKLAKKFGNNLNIFATVL